MTLHNVVNDGIHLAFESGVNQVGLVDPNHFPVSRDGDHTDLVGRSKLCCFRFCSTRHASTRSLRVQTEVVLQGHGRQCLVFRFDLHALFGFDRLVHAVVVSTSRQDTARVLVDDHDFTIFDDVVLVAVKKLLGLDGVI